MEPPQPPGVQHLLLSHLTDETEAEGGDLLNRCNSWELNPGAKASVVPSVEMSFGSPE